MTFSLTAPILAAGEDSPFPDDYPSITINVPDPLECAPARAGRVGGRGRLHPLYSTSVVDAAPITRPVEHTWDSIRIESIEPTCMVTFNRRQASFAGFSTKTGRMMSGLGPHEHAIWRELEVGPRWIDFDLQRSRTIWIDHVGSTSYLCDYIAVDEDGFVHAGEMKASASYYLDPTYSVLMENAANAYARIGITFRRDHGDGVRGSQRRRLNVDRAFGDRFTKVSPRQRAAAIGLVEAGGGTAPLGLVEDAMGVDARVARAVVNAMLCSRDLSYPLDERLNRDTPVGRPKTPAGIPDIRAIRHELVNS